MKKLFILLKSPGEFHAFDLMASLAGEDEAAALLFEDAVYFAANEVKGRELASVVDKVYVIGDDLRSRGFDALNGFEVIDYPRAVDLIMDEYDKTITV
jgi:sulfur relay protein TusB/DsrH